MRSYTIERHEGYQMVESYYYDRTKFGPKAEAEWKQVFFCPFCGKELPKDIEVQMINFQAACVAHWLKNGERLVHCFKLLSDKFGTKLMHNKAVIAKSQGFDIEDLQEKLAEELEIANPAKGVD